MTLSSLRRAMYRGASILGWINAAARGPAALAKRVVRVETYKAVNSVLRGLLK